MKKIYTTKSFQDTQKIGQDLAKEILNLPKQKHAIILCLSGNLGGGKTTFMQGFAQGLGIKEKILSPTFVIMKKFNNFYHIDCYRLNSDEDAVELGLKEIINNPQNIVAIEWPEKIESLLPKEIIKLDFKFVDDATREITIEK